METVRVLGYARVSSEEQARDGVSLDAQVTRIRAWAQATGAELVDIVIDPAVSGTRLLADRPPARGSPRCSTPESPRRTPWSCCGWTVLAVTPPSR